MLPVIFSLIDDNVFWLETNHMYKWEPGGYILTFPPPPQGGGKENENIQNREEKIQVKRGKKGENEKKGKNREKWERKMKKEAKKGVISS